MKKRTVYVHQISERRHTSFTFSKWQTLHIHAKISSHGSISTYIDFLIDRYCSRVYELALYNRALLDQDTILAKEDTMRLNCILSDTTYDDLLELSYIAMVNRTKMFRILLNWDTERPEPRVRLVA